MQHLLLSGLLFWFTLEKYHHCPGHHPEYEILFTDVGDVEMEIGKLICGSICSKSGQRYSKIFFHLLNFHPKGLYKFSFENYPAIYIIWLGNGILNYFSSDFYLKNYARNTTKSRLDFWFGNPDFLGFTKILANFI